MIGKAPAAGPVMSLDDAVARIRRAHARGMRAQALAAPLWELGARVDTSAAWEDFEAMKEVLALVAVGKIETHNFRVPH